MAAPKGLQDWTERPPADGGDLDETDSTVAAICAIDHFDWLAVMTALAEGGPGTSASAADLAMYVRDYDPDEDAAVDADQSGSADYDLDDLDEDEDEDDEFDEEYDEFDELTMEGLFLPVTTLWHVLGAIDDNDCLTPLGWWLSLIHI